MERCFAPTPSDTTAERNTVLSPIRVVDLIASMLPKAANHLSHQGRSQFVLRVPDLRSYRRPMLEPAGRPIDWQRVTSPPQWTAPVPCHASRLGASAVRLPPILPSRRTMAV